MYSPGVATQLYCVRAGNIAMAIAKAELLVSKASYTEP